jgi:hypothetical protein
VLATVELDAQSRIRTVEVGDVRSYRMLAAELEAAETTIAELGPELEFGIGLAGAKLPGVVAGWFSEAPHPTLSPEGRGF